MQFLEKENNQKFNQGSFMSFTYYGNTVNMKLCMVISIDFDRKACVLRIL